MFDEEQDKSAMRNQLIAIALMTVLLLVWTNFFMKPPVQRPPGPAPSEQAQTVPPTPEDETQPAETAEPAAPEPAEADSLLAALPLAVTVEEPERDEVVIEDKNTRAVFTAVGARLKRLYVKLHLHGEDEVQLVPQPEPETSPADAVYPFGLRFTDERIADALDQRRFEVAERDERSVVFELNAPGFVRVRKRYALSEAPHVLEVETAITGLGGDTMVLGEDMTPAFILNWGPNIDSRDLEKGARQSLVWRKDGRIENVLTSSMKQSGGGFFGGLKRMFLGGPAEPGKPKGPYEKSVRNPDWFGVKSAYFMVAMRPGFEDSTGWAKGEPGRFRFGVAVPRFELEPGATRKDACTVYIGPNYRPDLAAAWPTLPEAKRIFQGDTWWFMDWFAKLLLAMLNMFYAVIPSYGWGIIFLTVVVRMAMFPLTIKQMRSMKKMQLLQPEIEKLKEKCGEDQQELQKKMMELYRERGVNPLGGCLPMLLQLPVFISLYRMLWNAFELRGAPFTLIKWGDYHWISDLSEPDRLLDLAGIFPWITSLPFVGDYIEYLNVLPILAAASMVLSVKLTPQGGAAQNPQQKMMMTFMPIFFGVICYRFASGLNLYILTSTALGILQNKLVRAGDVDVTEKRPPRKKQHFYTAAQARKRRLAAESSGKKRSKKK